MIAVIEYSYIICICFYLSEIDDSIQNLKTCQSIRTDTYRASGAGGQHVNKTDSAVRLTHEPTGTVVQCQNDRSQHKNKENAFKQLKSKLYELELQKQKEEQKVLEDSKSDIGWGSQIRSYVLDQSRIKDLRTNVETGNTQNVLDGDIDIFIRENLKKECSMSDETQINESSILEERKKKLKLLRNQNKAYINNFVRKDRLSNIVKQYHSVSKDDLESKNIDGLSVAGRIVLKRVMGMLCFITIRDEITDLQIYVSKNDIDEYDEFKTWDIGDIVGIKGKLLELKLTNLLFMQIKQY